MITETLSAVSLCDAKMMKDIIIRMPRAEEFARLQG